MKFWLAVLLFSGVLVALAQCHGKDHGSKDELGHKRGKSFQKSINIFSFISKKKAGIGTCHLFRCLKILTLLSSVKNRVLKIIRQKDGFSQSTPAHGRFFCWKNMSCVDLFRLERFCGSDHVQTLRFHIISKRNGSETPCEYQKFETLKNKTLQIKTERNGFAQLFSSERNCSIPCSETFRNEYKQWPISNENDFEKTWNRDVWTRSVFESTIWKRPLKLLKFITVLQPLPILITIKWTFIGTQTFSDFV